jgi:CBS-domain-containing membrane protein
MQVADLMDTHVLTISVNDYAIEAKRLMSQHERAWIIALEQSQIAGVVLAQDLERLSEALLKERDVREYVSTDLLMVSRDAQPQEAERLLRRSGRDFLTVMDENWPIGILTQDALTQAFSTSPLRRQAG